MKIAKLIEYSTLNIDKAYTSDSVKSNLFEAGIVTKGRLEITVNDSILKLCPGDMIIIPPNSKRTVRDISENGTVFTEIQFNLSENFFGQNRFRFSRLNYNNARLADVLADEIKENNGALTDAANCIFNAFILRCLRENNEYNMTNSSHSNIYRDAITYMNKEMNTMLSVPEIAHNCGICETTLKNVFKQHTGRSVKKYYSELKIRQAAELLKKGINAKEVSVTLGFSTLSYFSQFFKRETGCSIRDFIKRNTP